MVFQLPTCGSCSSSCCLCTISSINFNMRSFLPVSFYFPVSLYILSYIHWILLAFLLDMEMHGVKSRLWSERDAWTCSKEVRVGPSKTNEYIACRHVIFQKRDLRRPSSCFDKALKHWTGTNRIKCERLEEIKWSQRLCADCWIICLFSISRLSNLFSWNPSLTPSCRKGWAAACFSHIFRQIEAVRNHEVATLTVDLARSQK